MADRYAPPRGIPTVESVCDNDHHWAGELAWKLPMVFPEDIPTTATCPECGAELRVLAGSYERDSETGVYVRTGPPDPAVVMLIN